MGKINLKNLKNCHGISLIEVIISIFVLAVVHLGVASLQVGVINGNSLERENAKALSTARQTLEDLKANAYSSIHNGSKQQDGYTINWTAADSSPENNLKTLTVVANWRQKGINRSKNLRTIISK
jgi:Tfp pilus assembly protein PilV